MAKETGVGLTVVGPELVCEVRGVKEDDPTFTDPKTGRSLKKHRLQFAVEYGAVGDVKQARLTMYPQEGVNVPKVVRGSCIIALLGAWAVVKGQATGRIDQLSLVV